MTNQFEMNRKLHLLSLRVSIIAQLLTKMGQGVISWLIAALVFCSQDGECFRDLCKQPDKCVPLDLDLNCVNETLNTTQRDESVILVVDIEIKHSVASDPVKLDPLKSAWNKSENFSFHLTKGDIHDWKFNFSHPKIASSKYYQRTLTVSFDGSNVIGTIGSLKEKMQEVDNQFKLDQEEKCQIFKDAVTVRRSSAVVFGIYRGEVFTKNGTKAIDIGTTLHVHFKKLKKTNTDELTYAGKSIDNECLRDNKPPMQVSYESFSKEFTKPTSRQ